jgi:UDP-GlcNAc:undecaprenyl-phosphate GlcNAc-1-phosphate transferase
MWMWAALVAFGAVLISLYSDEGWMWVSVAGMAALTIALTFLLPKLHHPPSIPPHPVVEDA